MINFIIYEKNTRWLQTYKNAILKLLGNRNDFYHIIIIKEYTKDEKKKIENLIGKNIFILNMDMPNITGLELAKEIRKTDDWISQIILIAPPEYFKNLQYRNKILMLDLISKNDNFENNLTESIAIALRIHTYQQSFDFTCNNEWYQIPYKDILYFEKDLNNNYTSLFTKNEVFKIKKNIKCLEKELLATYFLKTHQSCIVNINNIHKIDFTNNTIYFCNGKKTNLLSRQHKKRIKEKTANNHQL